MTGSIGTLACAGRPCLARLVMHPAGRAAATSSRAPGHAGGSHGALFSSPCGSLAAHQLTAAAGAVPAAGGGGMRSEGASCIRSVGRASRAGAPGNGNGGVVGANGRGISVVTRGKRGGFMAEMEAAKEEEGARVEFSLPLAIQMYPNVKLRNENKKIGVFDEDLAKLAEAMFKIMYETDGVGLAAPQVGVNYRLMVYNEAGVPGEGKEVVLVNPTITKFSKSKDMFEEGCLSFPKIYADVERPTGVQIEAQNLNGKKFKMTLDGFEARVFQHEYDHLDGVLFHDRMAPEVRATVQGQLDGLIEAHPQGEPKGV